MDREEDLESGGYSEKNENQESVKDEFYIFFRSVSFFPDFKAVRRSDIGNDEGWFVLLERQIV
jgi:hypothetical protein